MRIAKFEFADGSRFQSGEHPDAAVVGARLEMLRKQLSGELTPEDVLQDAKSKKSPLHSFFEWDDGEAAHQHRLQQARGLIRSVVAIYTHPDRPATKQRAYVHIAERDTPHYRELSHAMSLEGTRKMILQKAWSELKGWRQRYQDLKEFAEVFEAADQVEDRLPKGVRKTN